MAKVKGIFINDFKQDFIGRILSGEKVAETRNKRTLSSLVGQDVFLIETGKGKPIIRGIAYIAEEITADRKLWERMFPYLGIDSGSSFDWQEGTQRKILYLLDAVQEVKPYPLPADAVRHGRTWAEWDDPTYQILSAKGEIGK